MDATTDQDSTRAREAAVADTVAAIRALIEPEERAGDGPRRATLEAVRDRLIELGLRRELFPEADFPPPDDGTGDRLFQLSLDPDGRYALYLNRGTGRKDTPPHDHTTWAVVVGVTGEELNRFYRRTDDRSVAGVGIVEEVADAAVVAGTGVAMRGDDIHSIHMRGDAVKMHLHMYGRALNRLPGRVKYDVAAGTYQTYEGHPDVVVLGGADPG